MSIKVKSVFLALIVCCMAFCSGVCSGTAPTTLAPSAVPELPPYVRVVTNDTTGIIEITLSEEEFNDIAGKIIFPINKFTLPGDSPLLREIERTVIPAANSHDWQLVGLMLKGSSSPDGPVTWNQTLGDRRAQSILDYLRSRLAIEPSNDCIVENKAEDYDYLVTLMEKAGDSEASRVKAIVEKARGNGATIKQKLQKADDGRLWRRLLDTYYPQMRSARIVFFFRPIAPPAPECILPAEPEREAQEVAEVSEIPEIPEIPEIAEIAEVSEEAVSRYPVFALRSNLLVPLLNVGAELPIGNRWSVGVDYYYP